MYENFLGKKVAVRGVDAGVFIGTLEEVNNDTVRLSQARNVWMWEGATCLMQLAEEGIRSGKVSQTVDTVILTGVCQILLLSDMAVASFNKQPEWRA